MRMLSNTCFLTYIFFPSLYSSLPSWLPPAMLEIRILALYLGDQELCSKYFCEFYSMNYLEDYTLDESLEEGLDLFKHFC